MNKGTLIIKPLPEPTEGQPIDTWGLSKRETLLWDIGLFVVLPLLGVAAIVMILMTG